MFRNALRQSSRTVGAISVTGRVAAVSLASSPRPFYYNLSNRGKLRDFDHLHASTF